MRGDVGGFGAARSCQDRIGRGADEETRFNEEFIIVPTKRSIVVALAGVNLFLAAALILSGVSMLPQAQAQPGGVPSGNYIGVTAAITGQEYEMLYLVNLNARKMFTFAPTNAQTKKLQIFGVRDLKEDFGR